ncbi:type III effector HrpK domain-containing protein [Bradyrhizobium oligotrophicum]|uniref:type III effector HrpK domain-containing protein n=1 Tax=Bradyrhizobium oligotrophicum TaxID=44255 RepID=UPI003EB94EFD
MAVTPVNNNIRSGSYDNANTGNPPAVGAWEISQSEAEAAKNAGIILQRPEDDHRSAQDIIDADPLLKNLGNQSGVKDKLKERVGDFEHDADAAYRAAQVLDHVEKFDEDGHRIAGNDVANGRIDGFTKDGDARHGTEAGRLQDFDKYGFSNLKGELNHVPSAGDDKNARVEAEKLGIKWHRPQDDKRSAEDIIKASPLLANLGNQSGVKDALKEQVGDFEHDADAAYRAAQVLQHVEKFDENGNRIAGNDVGNGSIDGFTNSGEARHGTEAGRLQDFGKYGFSSLKGKFADVGEGRQEAEKLGFKWERPQDDKRSAEDIIDANPLLKNLGNQSGIKDALKERVGDFEHDADAAFRAAQVLDRTVMFDENGSPLSGNDVANSSIDGFTSSGEARHGTEAGRLQDFGKDGFSVFKALPSADQIPSYQDFVKNHPDAGDLSKEVAKNAAILAENYDMIRGKTGSGDTLTADALKKYKEQNTYLSDETKHALDFWSQPGMLAQLDMAGDNPALAKRDGKFGAENIKQWLANQAPKNDGEFATLLNGAATMSLVNGVDTSKVGKDIFDHPENYDGRTKAAVMMQLTEAGRTFEAGLKSEFWNPYGRDGLNGNKDKVRADIANKVALLGNDKDVQKYLTDGRAKALQDIVNTDPTLKGQIKDYYDNKFANGGGLADAMATKDDKGNTLSIGQAVEVFASEGQILHMALGRTGTPDYVGIVERSGKKADIEKYYLDNIVTGKSLNDEIGGGASIETALSNFTGEVAALNMVLDSKLVANNTEKLQTNLSDTISTKVFDSATSDDLLVAFGDGKGNLDEGKMLSALEEAQKANPEMFKDADGNPIKPADVVAALRGAWVDDIRQGAKIADSLAKLKLIDKPTNGIATAYGKGIFHLGSALFMGGILTARGVKNGTTSADKAGIASAAMQFSGLVLEGSSKWNKDIKDVSNRWGSWMSDGTLGKIENAGKILGGIGGILGGAFGIAGGVNSLNKGDTAGAGVGLTGGILGISAGIASTAEGVAALFGGSSSLVAGLGLASGILGATTAAFAAIGMMVLSIIEVSKHAGQQDDFYANLGPTLQQYGINGGPMTESDQPITEGA